MITSQKQKIFILFICTLLLFFQGQKTNAQINQFYYKELSQKINRHNTLYYSGTSSISDEKYDALMTELIEIEQHNPQWITSSSPTQHVGHTISETSPTLNHKSPMLSIKKMRKIQELINFDRWVKQKINVDSPTVSYYIEEKIDGIAISLQYENGRLIRGLTRGDGKRGQDVTDIIKKIPSIPKQLLKKYPKFIEIRGEIYISKLQFIKINKARKKLNKKLFANARNLAAGSLHLNDSNIASRRGLVMTAFGIGKVSTPIASTQKELLKRLDDFGFNIPLKGTLCPSIKETIHTIQKLMLQKNQLPYETDGLVIKVNNLIHQHSLGRTNKNMLGMIVFKFGGIQVSTTIQKIIWQIGRTGKITPVAILKPVWLDGSKISRVSIHNAEKLKQLNIHVGDTILIEKAGRVIPKIIKIVSSIQTAPVSLPHQCPVCLTPFVKIKDTISYHCNNTSCPARIKKQIEYFVERNKMDIQGLRPSLINQLVEKKLVSSPIDLYRLDLKMLKQLTGLSAMKAESILKSIKHSKTKPLEKILTALGIPFIGPQKAEILANQFKTMNALKSASIEELKTIPRIGEATARAIFNFFQDEQNQKIHYFSLHDAPYAKQE